MFPFRPKLRRSIFYALLAVTAAAVAIAQTESQIQSEQVKRVGTHMNCQCGACNENLNCLMSAGECHFCKPARTKIFEMQQSGQSDDVIVASFIKEYGQKIFRPDPASSFWMVPWVSLAVGGLLVWFVLRRMRHKAALVHATAGAVPIDPAIARYMAAAEKESDGLDR
jgi:cytochrome c-type biogenesis protein CcmH/NrfF